MFTEFDSDIMYCETCDNVVRTIECKPCLTIGQDNEVCPYCLYCPEC